MYWTLFEPTGKLGTIGTITSNTKFLFTKLSKVDEDNINYQAVSNLLDSSKWSKFAKEGLVEDTQNAVIGTPTVEMWMASWNKKYDDTLAFDANETGYTVGLTKESLSTEISFDAMQNKDGYTDTLYYPHYNIAGSDWNSCSGYFLASPSAFSSKHLASVNCKGPVTNGYYDFRWYDGVQEYGVRPVVALSADVELTQREDGVWEITE